MNNHVIVAGGFPTPGPKSPTYTFASHPRTLLTSRKKYRTPPL